MKRLLLFMALALTAIQPVPNALASDTLTIPSTGSKITLTIKDTVFPAVLYNTGPAKDLIKKLPLTVSLNQGQVDYCGTIAPIAYAKGDVSAGYRIGNLAYWIPGQDFVIFTEDEKGPAKTPDLVIIGQVSTGIQEIKELGSTINVRIDLDK